MVSVEKALYDGKGELRYRSSAAAEVDAIVLVQRVSLSNDDHIDLEHTQVAGGRVIQANKFAVDPEPERNRPLLCLAFRNRRMLLLQPTTFHHTREQRHDSLAIERCRADPAYNVATFPLQLACSDLALHVLQRSVFGIPDQRDVDARVLEIRGPEDIPVPNYNPSDRVR